MNPLPDGEGRSPGPCTACGKVCSAVGERILQGAGASESVPCCGDLAPRGKQGESRSRIGKSKSLIYNYMSNNF